MNQLLSDIYYLPLEELLFIIDDIAFVCAWCKVFACVLVIDDTSVTFGNSGFIPLRIDKITFPCSCGFISENFSVVCAIGGGGVAPV